MSAAAEGLLDCPLVEQVSRLQRGEITVCELTETALARAERMQPTLNCFIALDRDGALARARALDAICRDERRNMPLFGVPVAHKDIFAREGRVVTFASKLYAEHRASTTATVVKRFDAAGAVDLGTLNLTEFACGPYGLNVLVGHTRNPWNPDHVAGGSSSGSGAAVAARLVGASMGSDTGGSIRGPASACGVFGLLPTNGRVSRHGVLPLSHSLDNVAPLARSARDIARVLGVIAGKDVVDGASSGEPVPDYEADISAGLLDGLRIGQPINYYPEQLDGEIAAMLAKTAAVLADLGAAIVPLEVPDPRPLDALANILVVAEGSAYHRETIREHADLYTPAVRDRLLFGFGIDAVSYIDALRARGRELQSYMDAVFTRVDALLLPAMPRAAPRFDEVEAALSQASDLSFSIGKFTRSFNYLGLPALAVPHGRNALGLPIAFQLVGRPFQEALILRIAFAFEQAVPPRFPTFASTVEPVVPEPA
jgi:aspartyl-tRNA(Asn)/glutamyl-tRNA(Gln) amidotransferase subunit A